MFLKSNKNKEYSYKVLRVFKSNTNEKPFTTMVLFSKDANQKLINCEVTVWELLNVEAGDYIMMFDILSVDYEEKDKGYAIYKTLKIKSSQVKVIKEKQK